MSETTRTVALVTGANKGIGFQVAQELGKAGMTVYMGARDATRGEDAAKSLQSQGIDAHYLHLDLASEDSIIEAAQKIESDQGRLDVLVNNAGIVDKSDGLPSEADVASIRRIFETNFFATTFVTQKMLPLIKKSNAGRIVNVSSGLGSLTLNSNPLTGFSVTVLGYSASKAALNMLTVLLANELKDNGILVNSVDPGYTATDLNDHRGPQTIEEGAEEAVRLALLPNDGPTGGYFDRHGPRPW